MTVNCQNVLVGIGEFILDGNDLGATSGGVNVEKTVDIFEKEVDQLLDACGLVPTKWTVTVTTNLAEATLANLKIAWNEPGAISFPTANTRRLPVGYTQQLPEHTLEFRGVSPEGYDRAAHFRRAIQSAASAWMVGKGEMTMFPVSFRCLPDEAFALEEIYGEIIDYTAP